MKIYTTWCKECDIPFDTPHKLQSFCSKECYVTYKQRPIPIKINDKYGVLNKQTFCGNCCDVFKSHAEILKDDPERLSTDFIKKLSQCRCDEV